MSQWTHHFCDKCWRERYPNRSATRLRDYTGPCCGCGGAAHGIFIRADPSTLKCGGTGPEHEEEEHGREDK